MNSKTKTLDKISGYFFFTGFITSKLKNIPIAIVSAGLNIASLIAYLIGYLAWYVAALFYPNYPRRHEAWSGFAEFKKQYQIAALIGLIATIICLTDPLLIIPTAWIYTLSNLVWSTSEYHKIINPPPADEQYSSVKQGLYLRYALLVTTSSALTAVAASIAVLFPSTAFIVITGATILGIGLTIASLYYFGKCAFGHYPPDNIHHSYHTLADQLSCSLEHVPTPAPRPAPEPGYDRPTTAPAANDADEPELQIPTVCI